MQESKINSIITLLLIDRGKEFRNSYSLTKVLSWKFDILNVSEMIHELETTGLLIKVTLEGLSNYEITNKGRNFLEYILPEAKPLMLAKFHDEKNFLKSLFES